MSRDDGVRGSTDSPEWSPPRREAWTTSLPAIGEVRADTVTGQTRVWNGSDWVRDRMHVDFGGGKISQQLAATQEKLQAMRRRQDDRPTYLVGERRAPFVYLEEDVPNWASEDMAHVPEGMIVIDPFAGVWQALSLSPGTRRWFTHGRAVPHDLALIPARAGAVYLTDDPFGTVRGEVEINREDLALLVSYWYVECKQQCQELRDNFWDELVTEMHRPGGGRQASMQIKKTPTRRGRASARSVDPLTPWALRAGAEKLLADVTGDLNAGEHEHDAAHLKRVLDIRHRRAQLLDQLNEVDGFLQATEAILLTQKASA